MTRLFAFSVLGAVLFSASCMSSPTGDAGSGGATASGGSGGTPGSGGSGGSSGGSTPAGTGGQVSETGGSAGSAGAAGAPACDCPEDTHITIELPGGPRVYELPGRIDSCNIFLCEPPGVTVSLGSWRHDHYAFVACHPDGDCVYLETDEDAFTSTEGEITVREGYPASSATLEEPVAMDMTVLEGDGYTTVEVTFESAQGAGVTFQGTARACLVESHMICAI